MTLFPIIIIITIVGSLGSQWDPWDPRIVVPVPSTFWATQIRSVKTQIRGVSTQKSIIWNQIFLRYRLATVIFLHYRNVEKIPEKINSGIISP